MTKKTWKIALAFGLPWTVFMLVYYSIINDGLTTGLIIICLIFGLIGGVLFALFMQYAAKRLYKKTQVETASDEIILKEAGANHFKGKEGVGGKLVLTNKRLIFKSHKFNVQNHQENFDLTEIVSAQQAKIMKALNNGLLLELNNNEKHKFVVDAPSEWVSTIEHQKSINNIT
jgi:hypothetical protein